MPSLEPGVASGTIGNASLPNLREAAEIVSASLCARTDLHAPEGRVPPVLDLHQVRRSACSVRPVPTFRNQALQPKQAWMLVFGANQPVCLEQRPLTSTGCGTLSLSRSQAIRYPKVFWAQSSTMSKRRTMHQTHHEAATGSLSHRDAKLLRAVAIDTNVIDLHQERHRRTCIDLLLPEPLAVHAVIETQAHIRVEPSRTPPFHFVQYFPISQEG